MTIVRGDDPVLRARQAHEAPFLKEFSDHAARAVLEVWREDAPDEKRRTELAERSCVS